MVDLGVRLGGDHGLCAIGQAEARGFDHGQVVGAVADGGGLGEVDAQPIGLRDEGGEFGLTTQDGVLHGAGEMTVFNDEPIGPVLVEPGLDGDPAGKEIKAARHEDAVDAGSRQRAHEGSGAGIEAHPLGVCALELGLRQTGEHGDPLAQGALEGELTAHGPFGNGGHLSLASSKVRQLVQDGVEVLRPVEKLDIAQLCRTFTLRTSEGFVENFGPGLIARVAEEAPGVRLHFVQKPDKDSAPLREGTVDLETGVVEKSTSPELRTQALFGDRLVGVVRAGHPLGEGEVTPSRYASGRHIGISRRGPDRGPIDDALQAIGLEREIVTIVGGFATALALARATDLIASVPERHTGYLRAGMCSFPIPVATPEFTVSMLWHPRLDADLAHRWLRGCVRDACTEHR